MDCDNINREDAVYRSTVVALEGDAPSPPGGLCHFLRSKTGRCLSRKTLHRRLPCLTWLRSYNVECLMGDLVAGFTVGLMIIPQALAYGIVAGLSPSDGLYSAFMGCFVYFLLGSTLEMNIGPTAIMALMTYQYSSGGSAYAVLLCFISGIIELLAGVINLGFLINFISQPVISGFTSAAAITIASSQLKALFGLSLKTKGLVDTWVKVFSNIQEFRWQDLTLGVVCIVLLLILKEVRSIRWPCLDPSSRNLGQRVLKKVIFYLSVGRNALVVIIASVIAYSLDSDQPFTITGYVEPGIPSPSLPPFSTINPSTNETVTFLEIMNDIGIGVVMVPFIAVLDHIAIVSAFSKGRTFDATQEIITLGIATLAGSFFGSMPITGSLSRSAVNLSSGVRTPAGGLVTGVMVLLALAFLTPAFRYIPKSTLAAVIMCAVIHLIDYSVVLPLWRSKKVDLIPFSVTFVACLMWGLEWGILLGIVVNLSMLLFSIATPSVKVALVPPGKQHAGYVLVTPAHGISYPSTSHIRAAIRKAGLKQAGGSLPVVIDCTFIDMADYTSAKGIKGLVDDFQLRGQTLVFLCMKPRVLQTVAALHEGITVCSSLDALPEALADGETEVGIETVNGDALHSGGDLVVSTMISTPTSDTSDAANPLLTTTTFLDEK